MSGDDKIGNYEKLWQQPEKFFLVPRSGNVDTTASDSEVRYNIWEFMPLGDQFWVVDEELESVVVSKMIKAGVKVYDQFPDEDTADAMRAKRINEFVLVKNEHLSKIDKLLGMYFSIWYKPSLARIGYRDGNRLTMMNIYKNLIKMGIEIWSEKKWKAYRKTVEQNDEISNSSKL